MSNVIQQLSSEEKNSEEAGFYFSASYRQLTARINLWSPPTDVYETEKDIIVRVEIPGMKDSEFSISIDGRMLAVMGSRPGLTGLQAYYQMEIHTGEFLSIVELPGNVKFDEIEASYLDGFLQVRLPKDRS